MVMDFLFDGTLVRVETPGQECDYDVAIDAMMKACQQVLGWQEKQQTKEAHHDYKGVA